MGAFLDKPKMEKQNVHGEGNGLRYGVSSMQGWRVEMEDAHTAVIGLPHGLDPWSFFAVYDGHAGSQVARYCCEHLLEHITSNPDFQVSFMHRRTPSHTHARDQNIINRVCCCIVCSGRR